MLRSVVPGEATKHLSVRFVEEILRATNEDSALRTTARAARDQGGGRRIAAGPGEARGILRRLVR